MSADAAPSASSSPGPAQVELRLGPLLRHVGPTHATVWVETSGPCTVEILGSTRSTFTVAGHHYALVVVEGLEPGSQQEYEVRLDSGLVWPVPGSGLPPSTIRTPQQDGGATMRVSFGSCRYACPPAIGAQDAFGPCALDAMARRLRSVPVAERPDLLLLLGDQVYADETTSGTRARIAARRGDSEPTGQIRDFEEYTWLYEESWTDPDIRWLFSCVPTAMIFDDHDVHDDWNTSQLWRQDAARVSWWPERIVGALSSYWVYQHLGNLSPEDLAAEPTYAELCALPAGQDGEPLLRELAVAADREADGAKGYRWSFARDLGQVRVVVVDSRCGRILSDGHRSMLGEAEFRWLAEQLDGDYDHLLIGTSLPWLLAPALHDIEAWDERLAMDPHPRHAAWGEKLRRAGDLEHWAAFEVSFRRLAGLLREAAAGAAGRRPPACIAVLSGDVHHSYVTKVHWPDGDPSGLAPVYQLTCSPLHNRVPSPMRLAFRLAWSRLAERSVRLVLGRLARVPAARVGWRRDAGPFFGNAISTLVLSGRRASLVVESSEVAEGEPPLRVLHAQDLSVRPPQRSAAGCSPTGGSADHGKTIQRSVTRQE